MCQYCNEAPIAPTSLARRNILKFAGAAAAALALGGPALAKEAKMVPKPQNILTPDAALDRLMQGNKRYVDGLTKRHNFAHEREALTKGQNPFAAVLGCAELPGSPPNFASILRSVMSLCAGSPATSPTTTSSRALNSPLRF